MSSPMPTREQILSAISAVRDQRSFLQKLLAETLDWPIAESAGIPSDLGYGWSEDDLRTQGLDQRVLGGQIWQLQLIGNQPWGIFLVEFKDAKIYKSDLRKILRGLVPSRRRDPMSAAWKHTNLLFICTT